MPKQFCSDPLKVHKIKISQNLRIISSNLYKLCENKLEKNTLLCDNCRKKLKKDPTLLNTIEEVNPSDVEVASSTSSSSMKSSSSWHHAPENITEILQKLDVTPMKKRKLFKICTCTHNLK